MLKVFLCVNIYIFICVYECFYLCSTFCWCVNVLFIMPVYFVFCSSLSLNSQNIYIQLNSWMFVNLEYKAQAKTSRVLVEQFGREISLELFWPKFFFNYLTDENLPYLKSNVYGKSMLQWKLMNRLASAYLFYMSWYKEILILSKNWFLLSLGLIR